MRTFVRLLRYAIPYWWQLLLALLLSVVGVLIELARPWPVKFVVDYVLSNRPMPYPLTLAFVILPGFNSRQGALAWAVVVAIFVVLSAAIVSLGAMFVTIRVSQRLVYDLCMDVFAKLQRLSLAYHGKYPLGDLLQRASNDVYVVYSSVASVVLPTITSALSLAGMFYIMARLNLLLALVALAVAPLLIISLAIFSKPMDTTTSRQWSTQGSFMSLVEQSLSNIKLIQGFAREAFVQRKLQTSAQSLSIAYDRAIRTSATYQQVTTAITGLGSAAILGIGGWKVVSGSLSLGDLLVFLGYLTALYGPVSALSLSVGAAIQVVARGKRVLEVLDSQEELPVRAGAITLGRVQGEIRFDNVAFGYGQQNNGHSPHTVLQGITFTAQPGQTIAIVGATGAGKSSLISLLVRFYDPWSGRILLDGHDLRDVTPHSLRENISLVLQDPFLFPLSVADNIAFGRPCASRADVIHAARMAHAHEFIERLPDGYDTVLEEKGTSLSGGQRQRIAIARAIIKDAPVLIFDEPTSSLDARTEAEIFSSLAELTKGRTTFIISHRLSTIRRVDHVIALERGRIVEQGTHKQLLANDAVYASLFRNQHITLT